MTKRILFAGVSALALVQSLGTPARAQDANQSPSADSKVETVVVTGHRYKAEDSTTGTKVNLPIMDTPLNVVSVTQQVLLDQQAITLGQALQNVSAVSVTDENYFETGGASGGILVRGFIEQTYYRNGFRVDTTTLGADIFSTRQFANIDSVDVLKGPGAVLYGLVEPGGIVNVTTKQPQDIPYFAAEQEVGSLGEYRTSFDATGPVTDDGSLLYRVNGSYEYNGAPYGSVVDLVHSQNYFISPTLKWNVDSKTWVKLEVEFDRSLSDYYFTLDPSLNSVFLKLPRSVNYGDKSPWDQTSVYAGLSWSHDFNADWNVRQIFEFNWVGDDANFVSQLNFANNSCSYVPQPSPCVNVPLSDPRAYQVQNYSAERTFPQKTYSTEFDVSGHFSFFGLKQTLLFGGDYYRLEGQNYGEIYAQSNVDFFDPVHPGTPAPCAICFNFADAYLQETAGFYVQDQVTLPFDLHLLAGARYQYIHQTSLSGDTLQDLTPSANPLYGHAVTPRAGLLWRPQEWVSVYANYAEGFGANSGIIYPNTLVPPSNASSWETGVKFELFDGKLRATADYFDLTKTNIPTADLNPAHMCGGGGIGSCSLVIGEERSNGPELDVQGEILPGWNVIANATYDPVRVTKQNNVPGSPSYPATGQQVPNVPREQASLSTTYAFDGGIFDGLKIGGSLHYTGAKPVWNGVGAPTGNFAPIPGYVTVDLMAAYEFNLDGKKATIQLNITNLLNQTYYVAASNDANIDPNNLGQLLTGYRSYGPPFSALGAIRVEF